MAPDPPTNGANGWRLERVERDISAVQSDLRALRDTIDRAFTQNIAQLTTQVALLQADVLTIKQALLEVKQEQRDAEKDRDSSSKKFSAWMITFVTAILMLAIGSILNLIRS